MTTVPFRRYVEFVLLILFVVGVTISLLYVDGEAIVRAIGKEHIYLITFVFAIFGGVSALTATSFYAFLFALGAAGVSPLLLALASAPGVFVGDLVFWYVGREGRSIALLHARRGVEKFSGWFSRQPRWLVPVSAYIYTGLTPLPGDVLMVSLSIAGVPLRRIVVPILLGNYTLAVLISTFGIFVGSL